MARGLFSYPSLVTWMTILMSYTGEEEVQEEVQQSRRHIWHHGKTTTSPRPTSRSFRDNHLVVRTADVDGDTDKSEPHAAGGGGV